MAGKSRHHGIRDAIKLSGASTGSSEIKESSYLSLVKDGA